MGIISVTTALSGLKMADIVQNEWNVQWWELWADPMACLKCWFCTPCSVMWNLQSLGKPGSFSMCMCCCQPLAGAAIARTQTREKYGIEGSDLEDWCLTACCCECSIYQVMAEINKREES